MNRSESSCLSRIKAVLKENGFKDEDSQTAKLVELCGVSKRTARGWVRKERYPQRLSDVIFAVGEAFSILLDWLFTGEGIKDKATLEFARRLDALPKEAKRKVDKLISGLRGKDPYSVGLVGKYRAGEISADEFANSL